MEQYEVFAVAGSHLIDLVPIYRGAFMGMGDDGMVLAWLECCYHAFPRFRMFGLKSVEEIIGYIIWQEHGGFRARAVLELEQIAISEAWRRHGAGKVLVQESLRQIRAVLRGYGRKLKMVMVTTSADDGAGDFYNKVLGAEPVAVLPDIYRGDEQVMIWRKR